MNIIYRALPYVIAAALVAAVCLLFYRMGYDHADAAWQLKWAEASAAAEAQARTEEIRRQSEIEKVRTDAQDQIKQATADAAVATAAADSLRDHAKRLAAKASQCAGAATGGQAANTAGLVLADVLARADQAAGELAAAYDRARIAGHACERAYDALSDRQSQ